MAAACEHHDGDGTNDAFGFKVASNSNAYSAESSSQGGDVGGVNWPWRVVTMPLAIVTFDDGYRDHFELIHLIFQIYYQELQNHLHY